jgi:hypothetical protein
MASALPTRGRRFRLAGVGSRPAGARTMASAPLRLTGFSWHGMGEICKDFRWCEREFFSRASNDDDASCCLAAVRSRFKLRPRRASSRFCQFCESRINFSMQVNPTNFTVAEYCTQMTSGTIIVNRDYQRTDKVWPPAARSYLIDTILSGYPMPKISLFQKTDLKSRKTIKEIVDGQQRSKSILDFYNDRLRIVGKSDFSGKCFTEMEPPTQQKFIEYPITVDVIVNATEDDIRQLFRRMNSYNVPLNPQETRHATLQGAFKWFIVGVSEKYASTLKALGVFKESQLSRMADGLLLTEIVIGILD